MKPESNDARESIALKSTKKAIEHDGVESLTIDELTKADLTHLSWSGSPSHIRSVERALERVAKNEVEYLAARSPEGWPIAKCGIDYSINPGAGTLWQAVTHEALRGQGIGSRLITEAEGHIKKRGLKWVALGVEDDNIQAHKLYKRLGYTDGVHVQESWEQTDEHGQVHIYHANIIRMQKKLQ